jgi:periplasmic protein TonB
LQVRDHTQLYAIFGSLALHCALAAVLVYQFVSRPGAPAPNQPRTAIISVHLADFVPAANPGARASRTIADPVPVESPMRAATGAPAASSSMKQVAHVAPIGAMSGYVSSTSSDASASHLAGNAAFDYEQLVRNYLARYFVYPDAARPDRLGGTVELHAVIGRDGHLLSAWVKQSSGSAILDAAALDLVHRAEPLPALPANMADTLEISLPLEYAPPKILLGAN